MWTNDMRDEMLMPGICWFASDYARSRKRLMQLQDLESARYLFPHDPDTFKGGFWEEAKAYK
jgi:uncharacterized protein YebE (UPF0316 family)